MHDLFSRSPVRFFDTITEGGLVAGEIGFVASKKGLGKTAVLVQFGIDTLLKDEGIVHVSFDQTSNDVMTWYEDIFAEIAKKKNISAPADMLADLVRKRTILNCNQDVAGLSRTIATVKALGESGIQITSLLIDDLDFSKVTAAELAVFRKFVKDTGITAWVSANSEGNSLSSIINAEFAPSFDMIVRIASALDKTEIALLKLRGNSSPNIGLKLDSKTLLIAEK